MVSAIDYYHKFTNEEDKKFIQENILFMKTFMRFTASNPKIKLTKKNRILK